MTTILKILGIFSILVGGIFFLQGINILPGSFMTGQIKWAFYGGILIATGIGFLIWPKARR